MNHTVHTFGGRTDKGIRPERGFIVFIQSGQGTRLAQWHSDEREMREYLLGVACTFPFSGQEATLSQLAIILILLCASYEKSPYHHPFYTL